MCQTVHHIYVREIRPGAVLKQAPQTELEAMTPPPCATKEHWLALLRRKACDDNNAAPTPPIDRSPSNRPGTSLGATFVSPMTRQQNYGRTTL